MNAWGKNASFQLAAIHRLTLDLIETARILGMQTDRRWEKVRVSLPQASLFVAAGGGREIALWDGLALEESHRHHSHLGGICPFDTIDPDAAEWREIVANSIRRWIRLGMGQWSGWGTTWAAMIYSRLNNGDMAELILELWKRVYTNPGGGSLHDAFFPGVTLIDSRPHIMQMDATMGALTAIQDMLMHSRQGTIHVFAGVPRRWKHVSFENMPAPGGFLVSASRKGDDCLTVTVTATRAQPLSIVVHDWKPLDATLDGVDVPLRDGAFHCMLESGQVFHIERR